MDSKGWGREDVCTQETLPADWWMKGFFPRAGASGPQGAWRRDLSALLRRDLLLFALGDVRGKKVLEVGCGLGIYMEILARSGAEVCGQDLAEKDLSIGRMKMEARGFSPVMKVGNATALQFEDGTFDAVIAPDMLSYLSLPDKHVVAREVFRVLKPGGIFAYKTPNLDYARLSLLGKRIAALLRFQNPFSLHIPHTRNNPDSDYIGLTNAREMEEVLFSSGFHLPEVVKVPLLRPGLPFWVTRLLYGCVWFSDDLIGSARKPLFLGFYP